MKKQLYILTALLMAASMILAACATAPTVAPATSAPATAAPTVAPSPTVMPTVISGGEGCAANAPKITWFVGLGGGTDPAVIPQEKAWVDKYNKSQTYA